MSSPDNILWPRENFIIHWIQKMMMRKRKKKVREIFLYYKNQHRKHKKNIKSSLINELFLASLNERGDFHRDGINFSHTALLLSYLFPFLLWECKLLLVWCCSERSSIFFRGFKKSARDSRRFFLFFYLIINIFLIRQRERKNFLLLYFFDFVGIKLLAGNDRSLTVKSSVKHETFDVVC